MTRARDLASLGNAQLGVTESNLGIGTTNATSTLTVVGNSLFTGIITATKFVGDGSGLIGIVGSGSGVIVKNNGSLVGTAGTIDFGTNLSVTPVSAGVATVTASGGGGSGVSTYASVSGIATVAQGLTGVPNITVGVLTATSAIIGSAVTITSGGIRASGIVTASSFVPTSGYIKAADGTNSFYIYNTNGNVAFQGTIGASSINNASGYQAINFGTSSNPTVLIPNQLSISGNTNSSGIITATSFSGSGAMQSRTVVSGLTTSIVNNGIGNTNITGFKSYALLKVGLSTAGWLRLYTDSTSRTNDASRSIGIDPTPGSGVIAEVVTTGISTTQIITPFTIGGNLDSLVSSTIYAAITNLSGSTQAINAQLTILQLEV